MELWIVTRYYSSCYFSGEKGTEVAYADMFLSFQNHPKCQRDCGIRAPSDPLVLALEKESKTKRGKLKWCYSVYSIGQRCRKLDKVYQTVAQEQDLVDDSLKPPHIKNRKGMRMRMQTQRMQTLLQAHTGLDRSGYRQRGSGTRGRKGIG